MCPPEMFALRVAEEERGSQERREDVEDQEECLRAAWSRFPAKTEKEDRKGVPTEWSARQDMRFVSRVSFRRLGCESAPRGVFSREGCDFTHTGYESTGGVISQRV